MSWFLRLYETYEFCVKNPDFTNPPRADGEKESPALMPVSHTSQQVHIHVVLDGTGNFERAELFPPKTQIIIPATEDSAGRTSGPVPHPLIDKIHFCAKDYKGTKGNFFDAYRERLEKWCDSNHAHPKARAVRDYVSKGTLVHDLLAAGILHADSTGTLLTEAPEDLKNSLFNLLVPKDGIRDQGEALVAWSVVTPDDLEPRTWKDKSLQESWIAFDTAQMEQEDLCMIQGAVASIATKHPRNIRRPGDGAKIISANDTSGFTFRGRFLEAEEACTVGYEASQKTHNALRWLLARQSYRHDTQAVLAWSVEGKDVPNPCEILQELTDDDFAIDLDALDAPLPAPQKATTGHQDMGEAFGKRLRKAISGRKSDLSDSGGIAILALDSASPGRLSVTFYREQMPEHYLDRLEKWQQDCSWLLPIKKTVKDNKGKDKETHKFFVCAPEPSTIARIAYGRRIDDKLLKATVERLLPCIVDASPIPRDLMECCVHRACNMSRVKRQEWWEWQEVLGVACALYKGYYARHPKDAERRTYDMALDPTCRSRDYLYGRLLAVAEYVERRALMQADENRPTNAERLMQRFADHPNSTWLQLEKSLNPYMQRLRSNGKLGGLPTTAQKKMQEIFALFERDDFNASHKLSGEFLLGYHCQLSDLWKTPAHKSDAKVTETEE